MKKKLGLIISAALFITMSAACKQEEKIKEKPENYSVVTNIRMQVKETGIFYLDGYKQLMEFYDYGLKESIPVCDKPNCKHNSLRCNAYIENGFHSTLGNYRGKLYFFKPTSEEFSLYVSDTNGSNRKELAKLNKGGKHMGYMIKPPMWFIEDKIYLGVEYSELTNIPEKPEKSIWEFISISIKDGEIEVLKGPEEIEGKETYIDILSYQDKQLIYYKGEEICLYDMNTNQTATILTDVTKSRWFLGLDKQQKNMYYSEENEKYSEVYKLDLQTKEKTSIVKKEKNGKELVWDYSAEKFYYTLYDKDGSSVDGELGIYDSERKEERKISKEEYMYRPQYVGGDWYISMTEEGIVCIRKKDYEKKNWDKRQVMGRF
ncbi:hypothetical protein [Faecalimonas sp.]